MTTSEGGLPAFYLPIKRKTTSGLIVCALAVAPTKGGMVLTAGLRWSPVMAARLRAIARQAKASGKGEGHTLPYASLRASLQAQLPETVLLSFDLGAPWSRDEPGTLLSADGTAKDVATRAAAALSTWTTMVLRPWAERVDVDDALVDGVVDLATPEDAFQHPVGETLLDLGERIRSGAPLHEVKHAILQVVSRRLEGEELFEGLGPVFRIVRRGARDNAVEFMTWPTAAKDDARYSMVASVSVETAPYLPHPLLVVTAKRRGWLSDVPEPKRLRRQSTMRGYLLSKGGAPVAMEFVTDVRDGKPAEPFSPEFMLHALNVRYDLGTKLSEMVARQGAGGVFLGLPRSPAAGQGGASGTSTRDQSDLFEKIASLLKGDGFAPLPCEQTPELKKIPKRAEEHHRALAIEALLADIGLQLGRNEVGEDSFREAWEILSTGDLPPKLEISKAEKARAELETVRDWNRQRVVRAFGDLVPRLVLIAATSQERTSLRLCIDALFGRSVDVVEFALPANVHGPRPDLPKPQGKALERFTERVAAWEPLAGTLSVGGAPNHVIVQASDWYERRKDDPVNKLAGRYALASKADANVQYLRPPGNRSKDFANYLHRVQAATYDLLFGHSGLVSEIATVLEAGFPDAATRPRSIIGISVVTQSRTRAGANGGRLCLATRVDVAQGTTTARVGWFDRGMRWSPEWIPLFEALKTIASPQVLASLGEGLDVERASFQAFTKTIVDEATRGGDRPLILIDSTSAATLWPSLTDRGIAEGLKIGPEQIEVGATWTGARVVRIRTDRAARLIEAKSRAYERIGKDGERVAGEPARPRYCPTITERTVKVSSDPVGGGTHYWMTHGYFQMSFPRGLSVYRALPALMPATKLKVALPDALADKRVLCEREVDISTETYRLPRSIDVTVLLMQPGDEADRIAHVIASLRHGYGHTAATTSLPAPLSFEVKARDYMTRFALDEADLQDDDEDPDDDGSDPAGDDGPPPVSEIAKEAISPGDPLLPVRETVGASREVAEIGTAPMASTALPSGVKPPPEPKPKPAAPRTDPNEVNLASLPGIRSIRGTGVPPMEHDASKEETMGSGETIWSLTTKEPVLPVPDFVTAAWLRPKISAPNSVLRVIHDWRGEIETLSGFKGWPARKPTIDEFCELLVDGFRYPGFLRAVTRGAMRTQHSRKRPGYNLFLPFSSLVHGRLFALNDGVDPARLMSEEKPLRRLCETGKADLFLGIAYLVSLGPGPNPVFLKVAEAFPELTRSIFPFLHAATEHLASDFDWKRDLVELRGSPTSPPTPRARPTSAVVSLEPVLNAPELDRDVISDVPTGGLVPPEKNEAITSSDVPSAEIAPFVSLAARAPTIAVDPVKHPAWQDAILRVSRAAAAARPDPEPGIVQELRLAVLDARRAYRAWVAAQPRYVDGRAVASEAIALAPGIGIETSGCRLVSALERTDVFPLLPDELAALTDELSGVVAVRAEADDARARAQALMLAGDLKRYDEIGALKKSGDDASAVAVERLSALLARLTDLAERVPALSMPVLNAPEVEPPRERSAEAPDVPPESPGQGIDDASLELMDELAAEDEPDVPAVGTPVDEPLIQVDAVAPVEPKFVDPFAERIDRKLVSLMERFEVGLAYHLVRAAGQSFPSHDFAFDADELRLCAMAPHLNHAAMQGNELLATTLERSFEAAERSSPVDEGGSSDLPEEVRQARRLALFGAVSSLVLFHPGTVAGQLLSSLRAIAPALDVSLYPLRDALVEASRSRLTLTPAMFRAVNRQVAEDRHTDVCRDEITTKIDAIGRLQFKFQLGLRIRSALVRGDGALGRLQDAIRTNGHVGLEAARAFAETYGDRGRIIELLNEAEASSNGRRVQGIDGEARERLVANIAELTGLCLAYVQAKEAAPAMNVAGQRVLVQNLRASIVEGIDRALPALSSLPEDGAPLFLQSAEFTARMLQRLRNALDGRLPSATPYDHLIAVHGVLPWVPGLRFGNSWLPSPYAADTVVSRLLQVDAGICDPAPQAFEAAVRRCVDEDCFVAAGLLLDQGAFRGIDGTVRENMRVMVTANAVTRRDKLTADVAEVRRAVDRVQRLGALVGANDGQDLISLLERILPARIPAFIEPDARSEAEEQETILDFVAAQAILDEVTDRVSQLLDKPRGELQSRLDALVAQGRAVKEDAGRVRQLIGKDDLLTAGEYLEFIADGRGIPESSSPNPRFKDFFPAVPNFLAAGDIDRKRLREAMLSGDDLGPLTFSKVPAGRREDGVKLYDEWQELARRVQAGVSDLTGTTAFLGTLLDAIGLHSEIVKVDGTLSSPRRKIYAADMRLVIAQDAEGVLLPEFGSQTGGNYRVVVLARIPTEVELTFLCANAGAQGVIIFVMETVSRDRRHQIARDAIKAKRKVLVIDEAILLFALSEAAFRPLTLIECAQPFSFASPYRDYGNQPVPPEIFFGRETEYRKIVDPSGSCIVYGGRRLGKTALLQQVKAKENAPSAGTAVAYVNILAIGNHAMPSEIWFFASSELPAIFKEPVSSAPEFKTGVNRWLDADSRRRILVLFDEADRFIRADSDDGFREFIPLQSLMDTTGRRFKFVLAGLHNVTRLVHTENPPLKQIASEPQRIGPLMNEELKDAELLVTRPLAALGYEFQNREDVWRILSHCNYYPVLVQTFCKGLLEALTKEAEQASKVLFPITEEHVRRALENEHISGEIGQMFEYTIKIDDRYDLIANIMAERSLQDTAAGRVGEGMSAVEVMEAAARGWPAAFTQNHRLSIVEDLLDEMEGLGVLRRGPDDVWSLRSQAILRLLGNDTKITSRLVEFIDRAAPLPFEPRTMRRELRLAALYKVTKGHSCPLTLGQEHDLLTTEVGAPHAPIHLIFGNGMSDITVVGPAMKTFEVAPRVGRRAEVVAKAWPSVDAMLEEFRTMRSDAERTLFVVDVKSDWNHTWISTLLRSRSVREGRLSAAFVGGPEHALRWVGVPKGSFPASAVRLMPLQLWSSAMVEHHLGRIDTPAAQYRDELRRLTGGFNRPMSQAIGGSAASDKAPDKLQGQLERQHERLLAERTLLADLGLIGPMRQVYERMPGWIESGGITLYEISEGILPEVPEAADLDGAKVVEFGLLLGLLGSEALPPGATEENRRYVLNPLLVEALRPLTAQAQAAA